MSNPGAGAGPAQVQSGWLNSILPVDEVIVMRTDTTAILMEIKTVNVIAFPMRRPAGAET